MSHLRIDTAEPDAEQDGLRKQLRQIVGAKNKLAEQMDSLDMTEKHYDRKYQDMQDRLDDIYEHEQSDGRFLISISFKFLVFYDRQKIRGLR